MRSCLTETWHSSLAHGVIEKPGTKMQIRKTLWNIRHNLQIIWRYKNYAEILAKTSKKQRINRVILRNGVQIEVPEDHNFLLYMTDETFFEDIHTPPDLPIEADDVVVDIGANVGVVTLFAALRTRKTVHAFEPSPENCEFIKRNAFKSGLNNVAVHQVAVGDKTEKHTRLYVADSVGNSLLSAELSASKFSTENYIDVPSVTLQNIIDNTESGEIDYLKIDCEGCEGMIFLSTPVEYIKKVKKMVVEFHDTSSPLKHDAIQKLLEEAGFEVWLDWRLGKDSPYGYIYAKRLSK
jgi:FkbM family methyltransferase